MLIEPLMHRPSSLALSHLCVTFASPRSLSIYPQHILSAPFICTVRAFVPRSTTVLASPHGPAADPQAVPPQPDVDLQGPLYYL